MIAKIRASISNYRRIKYNYHLLAHSVIKYKIFLLTELAIVYLNYRKIVLYEIIFSFYINS